MITVMFSKNSVFHIDMMLKCQSFNTYYFINSVFKPTVDIECSEIEVKNNK